MSDTPAQPASPWRRFMSTVYEAVLLFGVVFAAAFPFAVLRPRGAAGSADLATTAPLSLQVWLVVVLATYFGWFWSRGRRTLPMKTMAVRLVTDAGAPLAPARAVVRFALALACLLAPLALAKAIGVIGLAAYLPVVGWPLLDRARRAPWDVLAGTRLVVSRD